MNQLKQVHDEQEELLSLFLFSMGPYHRLAGALPFSETNLICCEEEVCKNKLPGPFDADMVAVEARLMLQRKYFQNNERLHFKKVLAALEKSNKASDLDVMRLQGAIGEMKSGEIEIATGNGEIRRGAHQNIEDSTYGFLLHADIDRARRIASISDESRIIALQNFVIKREEVLILLEKAVSDAGFLSLRDIAENGYPAIVRFSRTSSEDLGISGSPKWHGLAGRDLDTEGVSAHALANGIDDNMAILAAGEFLGTLLSCPLDIEALRGQTAFWTWDDWGDFSEAADLYGTFKQPGFSSRVLHEGGADWAQIKIFENVEKPFEIETPQLIEGISFVTLRRVFGEWKVVEFADGRDRRSASSE